MVQFATTRRAVPRHRSPVLLVTCLLLLATGLALAGTAATLSRPALPALDQEGDAEVNVALARRFYAAVAAVLATGESGDLPALVAAGLIDHPVAPDGETGAAGLVRALLALHAVAPGLGLAIDDLHATGADLVTARVHATGQREGTFLGLPVPATFEMLGPIDVLRIADHRIVERWTTGETVRFRPLAQEPLGTPNPDAASDELTLTRVTLGPGARLSVGITRATRFLLVESGDLTVTVMNSPVAPDALRRLEADDLFVIAPGTAYTLANQTRDPVVAVAVTTARSWNVSGVGLMPHGEALAGGGTLPPQVAVRVLTVAVAPGGVSGSTLGIGRVALAAGTAWSLPVQAGVVVVAVESGRLDVAATGGDVHGFPAVGGTLVGPGAILGAGDRAAFEAGIGAVWKAGPNAPAVLLVVVLAVPDDRVLVMSTVAGTAAVTDSPCIGLACPCQGTPGGSCPTSLAPELATRPAVLCTGPQGSLNPGSCPTPVLPATPSPREEAFPP